MKTILLIFIFAIFSNFASIGQNVEWDFPIKPGSEQWVNLKNVTERIQVCQIPDSVVSLLTNKQLIDLVINHPFFLSYGLSNSPIEGFKGSVYSFNGYKELINRDGSSQEIIQYYNSLDFSQINKFASELEKGRYSLKIHGIEMIMTDDRFISKLTDKQKEAFLKIIDSKYNQKMLYKEHLGGFGSVTTAYLGLKLIRNMPKNKNLIALSDPSLKIFEERMTPFKNELINEIIVKIKEVVNNTN